MKPGSETAGWREAHIGFEDDGLKIDGLEIWKLKWRAAGSRSVQLPHPAHPRQIHRYDIHEVGDIAHPVRFAACELSNGVWGFYVPADRPDTSVGFSDDESLRFENHSRPAKGPHDRDSSCAVLIDSGDGRVLVDCAGWTSSRITANPDGSLSLHLRQNNFDVLFGVNPRARLFRNVVEPGPGLPLSRIAGVVEQARLEVIRQSVKPVMRHISPDGRILVDLVSVEWSNTHWVNSPRVTDVSEGRIVLDLWNTDWDAEASFPGNNRVRLDCRRYHVGGGLAVELDLMRKTCQIFIGPRHQQPLPEVPLADIAKIMEAASRQAADIAGSRRSRDGQMRETSRPHRLAAWRTALLILVGALIAISAGTYWWLHDAPASAQKLDTVPAMPK